MPLEKSWRSGRVVDSISFEKDTLKKTVYRKVHEGEREVVNNPNSATTQNY